MEKDAKSLPVVEINVDSVSRLRKEKDLREEIELPRKEMEKSQFPLGIK